MPCRPAGSARHRFQACQRQLQQQLAAVQQQVRDAGALGVVRVAGCLPLAVGPAPDAALSLAGCCISNGCLPLAPSQTSGGGSVLPEVAVIQCRQAGGRQALLVCCPPANQAT